MSQEQLLALIFSNAGTLFFAFIGSIALTFMSIKEHLDRDPKDKMTNGKYSLYFIGWSIGYPILGVVVALAYLASGNQFGSWLALQIGLTSPAIVAGIASSGANALSTNGITTVPDQ